jgi:peptide-methionine (R)-S-oxide reductase
MKFFPAPYPAIVATVIAMFTVLLFQASSTKALVSTNNRHPLRKTKALYNKNTVRFSTNGNDGKEKTNVDLKEQDFKPATWNPLRLMVMKLGFTELRWTSPLNYEKRDGVFNCAYCGLGLFDSDGKYDSGSGWPSFWRSTENGHVDYKKEWDGRLECLCAKCDAHLGHVFLDGPRPSSLPKKLCETAPLSDPRGRTDSAFLPRFCVNGASLKFEERKD